MKEAVDMNFLQTDNRILAGILRDSVQILQDSISVVGFDGYIDKVVLVRQERSGDTEYADQGDSYFKTLREFAAYLSNKDGFSCSIEMETTVEKIGGNMPIAGHALGCLGVQTHCIGALGSYPEVAPIFYNMSSNCKLYPIVNPGWCVAMQFSNGKVMMYDNQEINNLKFTTIVDCLSLSSLINIFERSQLIGLFNWSELKNAQDIWQGLITHVFPALTKNNARKIMIDISDCSGRDNSKVYEMLSYIRQISEMIATIVSVNENEARMLACILDINDSCMDENDKDGYYERIIVDLKKAVGCTIFIIHLIDRSISVDNNNQSTMVKHRFIKNPTLQIGGGDNYNAGVCAGLLCGFSISDCMVIGGAVGSYYVENGNSPNLFQLVRYLEEHHSS